jgi:hypothetical protein
MSGDIMNEDMCKTVTLYVVVEENGIIRDDKGWIVGRASDEWMRYHWLMLESGICPCCGREVPVE